MDLFHEGGQEHVQLLGEGIGVVGIREVEPGEENVAEAVVQIEVGVDELEGLQGEYK